MSLKHNFDRFIKDIDKQIKNKQKKAKKVLKETALNFLEEVQESSPVDTGRYQAGHILSKDNPSRYNPGKKGNFGGQTSKNKFDAERVLDNIKEGERATIFVTNNVEYAETIEHGSSKRTPQLVYEKSRIKNKRFYENEKKKEGL